MQNLSDQELDKHFREAAEQQQLPYEQEQWNRMAARLSTTPKPFYARWQTWAVGVLIISVATWLWWSIPSSNQTAPTPDVVVRVEASKEKNIKVALPSEQPQAQQPPRGQTISSASVLRSSHIPVFSEPELSERSHVNTADQENPVQPLSDNQTSTNNTVARRVEDRVQSQSMSPTPDDSVAQEKLEQVMVKEDEPSANQEKPKKSTNHTNGTWYVKATFAPDYSTVSGSKPGQAGTNYGALVGFQWATRWSVEAGVLRANKVYTAENVEYSGYTAGRLSGECIMLDIPVNVYYTIGHTSRTRFFIGAGLSSYLMQQEDYISYVDTPYGTQEYTWSVTGQNKEWFQVINLSAGLEQQLNSQWSFQVEPFLKAPLAGVGEGDVSLASFGAFFSIKYLLRKP